LDNSLRELAKEHTLEAMKIEIQQNQQLIDTTPVYRNTYRTTKIEVLRAIVRNHILRQFLHLSSEDRTFQNLKRLKGTSNEFEIFISNISATSYAYEVTYNAEKQLFLDYKHVNHRNTDYFLEQLLLDPSLEEQDATIRITRTTRTTRIFSSVFNMIRKTVNIAGLSISWLITIFFVVCIIGAVIGTIRNHEPNRLEADSTGNSNAIVGSDSDNKMRSLDVEIEDHSTASNFGNEGISGNDSSEDSVDDTATENVIDTSLSTLPPEAVKSDDHSFEKDTEDQTLVLVPVEEEEPIAIEIPEETFTMGSTKNQVKAVMGNPTSNLGSSWNYEYSSVQFDQNEQVDGWSNISHNLKAYMGDQKEHASPFTLDSTEEDVVDSMGTPTSIIGTTWGYEYSMVNFDRNHTVIGWSNISDNLNVSIGLAQKDAIPFTTHSSKQEVINAMGTPTSIIGDTWSYDYSSIRFDNSGEVISWSDISHNLKIDSLN